MKKNIAHSRKTFFPETYKTPKPLAFKGDGHKFIGMFEPEWPSLEIQGQWNRSEYETKLQEAYHWYNATHSNKNGYDLAIVAITQLKHRPEILKTIKSSTENLSHTITWLIRMMHMGMKLRYREGKVLVKALRNCVANQKVVDKTVKDSAPLPNVQDHTAAKINRLKGEIDALFDSFVDSDYRGTKRTILDIVQEHSVPNNRLKDLIEYCIHYLNEYKEVIEGKDPDLVEGYSHVGKRNIKSIIVWWEKAISDISSFGNFKEKKAQKPLSPAKRVAKLKFLKEFQILNLTSIDPTAILKSNELWIFNTKTRKIGQYVSLNNSTFDVKGTKLTNIDPTKSIQKTIRKPEEQLPLFRAMNKVDAAKWFADIKAVATPLREAIGAESVLLKAGK